MPHRKGSMSIKKTKIVGRIYREEIEKDEKKKERETVEIERNPKRLVFGEVKDLQVYTYPYDFPNMIFIGIHPFSVGITERELNTLWGVLSRARAYFRLMKKSLPTPPKYGAKNKSAREFRKAIVKAYNAGLTEKTPSEGKNGEQEEWKEWKRSSF
jgi:hypothetical protein